MDSHVTYMSVLDIRHTNNECNRTVEQVFHGDLRRSKVSVQSDNTGRCANIVMLTFELSC